MPTIDWNKKVWDGVYAWPLDGDEWVEQAEFCGIPYGKWKDQLVRTFVIPHLRPQSTMLEIGPGHGRWAVLFPKKVASLHLVDLSPSCIEFCRKRLGEHLNVSYHVNDGRTLPMIQSASIDFVWSFDTFVHIEEPEVKSYAAELYRVMKPQSMGVIHHAGSPTPEQRQNGMRSMVDSRKMVEILVENKLVLIRQTSEWGDGCNMRLTGDTLTVFARP
jgi:ubiquinone/menaquinone biosynthesis C-methylase UbiE